MLSVDSLCFAYGDGAPVLTDVTFTAGAGDVTAIVGRNGAGKSTLLRLLNGLLQPSSGQVIVNGNVTSQTPVHRLARQIGTVFQAPEQQIFAAKVAEEIAFGPRRLGLRGAALKTRVADVLARVGLADVAERHPLDLDAASLRFVALGSVLAMRPPIMLLDEPQRGLDAVSLARLERIVAEEAAAGTTLLIVCHDMEFVARLASRVLALARGRIAADLPTHAFFVDSALTAAAGVEAPDPLQLAQLLGLAPHLTATSLAHAWLARHGPLPEPNGRRPQPGERRGDDFNEPTRLL
jgi:energy-coupling factor transport system ATP-binding protein